MTIRLWWTTCNFECACVDRKRVSFFCIISIFSYIFIYIYIKNWLTFKCNWNSLWYDDGVSDIRYANIMLHYAIVHGLARESRYIENANNNIHDKLIHPPIYCAHPLTHWQKWTHIKQTIYTYIYIDEQTETGRENEKEFDCLLVFFCPLKISTRLYTI